MPTAIYAQTQIDGTDYEWAEFAGPRFSLWTLIAEMARLVLRVKPELKKLDIVCRLEQK